MRLVHRIVGLVGGPRPPSIPAARMPAAPAPAPGAPEASPLSDPVDAPAGPGAATAAALAADPCGPARTAVEDACSLADRMSALALAAHERHREARRAYDEHAGRREKAAAAADPRAIRAAKDEAQAAFRRARLAAADRAALESAAREWLREVDRINARTREAVRLVAREDAAELGLLQAVDRLGIEADGARISAESAAEACRNARIALATCEEHERTGLGRAASPEPAGAGLVPASVVARATHAPPAEGPVEAPVEGIASAAPGWAPVSPGRPAGGEADREGEEDREGEADDQPAAVEPAILPLLAGDVAVLRRMASTLAEGDAAAERRWEGHLRAFVEAVRARAVDGAALTFPEDHVFWGPYTQAQCREISAALAALGYRYDGMGGFADGRIPGQRELSLAIGYAGLDPMRVRIWPSEAELAVLYSDVNVDAGGFVAGAAGELTLGEMIDMLGRRAEDLGELWNAWGRVRPLLLGPA